MIKKAVCVGVALLFLSGAAFASEDLSCADSAALEFGIPPKVFSALVEYTRQEQPSPKLFGPMKLYEGAINIASEKIGITADKAKGDDCQNYRVAAWWLMNPSGGNKEADIWIAVKRYFHGNKLVPESLDQSVAVRKIYDDVAALSANSLPQPSLDRPCLPLSSDGMSRFLPSEVENADFCAPRGIAIKSVTMSDSGVWVTSQPWRTDIQGPHLPDRLAFLKVNDHPGSISMSIETAEDIYQINIMAEPSSGAE
ncbi:TPA: hypothetical protein I8303_003504 [Aeromonas hydrophila]|nr:hypothetical protein [Aeromonas hydrophila]